MALARELQRKEDEAYTRQLQRAERGEHLGGVNRQQARKVATPQARGGLRGADGPARQTGRRRGGGRFKASWRAS